MSFNRYEWIDTAKGLGILLVVYGHCQPPESINKFVYAFHMPLFFFISGFLFKKDKTGFGNFIIKKAKRLLLPYFVFSLISIPVEYARFRIGEVDSFSVISVISDFFNLHGAVVYNTPLWFLTCLFMSLLIFYFLVRLKFWVQISWIILSLAIGYFLATRHIVLPFSIDNATIAVSFIFLGYHSRRILLGIQAKKRIYHFGFTLMAGILTWVISSLHGKVGMGNMIIDNWFLFFSGSLTGIIMTFSIVQLLPGKRILKYFGINSLAVMINHFYVLSAFGLMLILAGKHQVLFENYIVLQSILYFAFFLVFSVPAINVYNFIILNVNQVLFPEGKAPLFTQLYNRLFVKT